MKPPTFKPFLCYNVFCTSPSRRAGRSNSHPPTGDAANPQVAPAAVQATRQRHSFSAILR